MKRPFLLLIAFILIFTTCVPISVAAQAEKGLITPPSLEAPSGILINTKTGDVLWQKNPDEKRPIASTTKIMTAILAIENGSLDKAVTINSDAASITENGMKLTPGEQIKLRDLLYALMLDSANDAAVAIADFIDGSLPKFVARMNAKAKGIGAVNTNYANPNGLVDKDEQGAIVHFSTARDLATIAKYAMRNKIFATIVGTKQRTIYREDPSKPRVMVNLNRLLWTYPGANGVKTGYTDDAGHCLVASAQREGVSLITVVLGEKSHAAVFRESATLLNYGFSLYEKKRLIFKNITYKTVKLSYGQKVSLSVPSNVDAVVKRTVKTNVKIELKPNIGAPIKKGAVLGKISILQSGKPVATSALVADKNIQKPSFGEILGYYWRQFWQGLMRL